MAIKNIYDTEISAVSFTWNGNTIATQAWVNANVSTPTLDAVTTAGGTTSNDITVGNITASSSLLGGSYTQPAGSSWTTSNSQLILGGAHNAGFNTGTKAKLLISGYDNDGSTIYPIFVEDENGYADFWVKNRSSAAGESTAFFSGKVGIGTTSPSRRLDVDGIQGWQLSNLETAYLNPTATGADFALKDQNNTNIIRFDSRPNAVSYFNGGNVGIGTTAPGTYKLNVAGTGYYSNQLTVDGFTNNAGISFRNGYSPTNTGIRAKAIGTANRDGVELLGYNGIDFSVNNGANVAMRIVGVTGSGMGNVGIGTTSPSQKLDVNGVIAATGGNSTNWNTAYGWGNHASAGYLTSYSETDTLATVVARGAFFGTTNQGYVDSGGTYGTNLRKISRITLTHGGSNWNSDNHAILSKGLNGADDDSISINSYNGIHLRLDSNNNDVNSNTNFTIHNNTTTNTNELFRVTGDGNVGIGTTSPSQKLQVGTGSLDDRIRVYFNDGTYSEQTGWGMEFARNASYLRPNNDNVRTLNVGDASHTWANVNIDATSLKWNTNTLATQSWVIANTGTPTLDAVTTAGNVTTNNIGVGLIELSGDTEHRLYRATTSLIKGTTTDTTILTGRTLDLYAYDDVNIRAGSSDNISFTAGGVSNAMYINSSGNVGIGTTSPGYKLDVNGSMHSTNITIADAIYHEGDTNTYIRFNTDTIELITGGGVRTTINNSGVKFGNNTIIAGGSTLSLGERAEADDNGRTVLIEGVANAGSGEGSGRIFFSEHNSTTAGAESYGLSLYYEGDPNATLPSGFQPNTGNGTWSLRRHNNSVNGAAIMSGSRTNSDVQFGGSITIGSGVTLSESTDRADLLSVTSSTSGWGGLQITNTAGEGIWSFMVDGAAAGIYDDQNGDWAVYCVENSYVQLRHNGTGKLTTSSSGVDVAGRIYLSANNSHIEFNTSASSGHPKIQMGADADFSFVNTAGSTNLHIENGGNVGIGTTSPSRQLHVSGSTFGAVLISGVASDAFSEYDDGTNVWKAGIDYSQSAYRITHTNFNGAGISLDSGGNLTVDGDTTMAGSLYMANSTNSGRLYADNFGLKVGTSSGYIQFGPANTTWAHIYTDRPNFYFNKNLFVLGNRLATESWVTGQGYGAVYTPDVYEWAGGLFNANGIPIDIAGPMVNGTTTTSQVSPSEIQFTAAGTYMISWSLNWESLYANRSVFGAGAYLNGFIIPGSSNLQYFRYNTYGHASTTNATFSVQVAANDVISWRTLLHSGAVNHATTPIGGDMGVITIHKIA